MLYTAKHSDQALKARLSQARSNRQPFPFSDQAKIKAKEAIRTGAISKKQICEAYRMNYKQLQQALALEQK